MLINLFARQEDYEKTLCRRRWFFVALLLLGVTGNVCSWTLLPDSGLPDFVRGCYSGGAGGLTGSALVFLIRTQYLINNPEARKEARIKETDEREKAIGQTAFYFAGLATFYVSVLALFILLPINIGASLALMGMGLFYTLSLVVASAWLSKHK